MSIIFNSEKKCFLLNTPNSTYVIRIHEENYLLHGGWFRRIKNWTDGCVMPTLDYSFSANPSDTYGKSFFSLDSQQQEFPVGGRSDFRTSAIDIELADGTMALDLRYSGHRIFSGKKSIEGLPSTYVENEKEADSLEIDLCDGVAGILVTLSYTVWNSYDAICRHVTVKNTGDGKSIFSGKEIILRRVMSASLDFSDSNYKLLTLSGAHARERHAVIRDVVQGIQSVESRRGMGGHQQNPFMAILSGEATENFGEVFGFSLVYSGNFTAMAEVDQFHMTRVQMGINDYNFAWHLGVGESFYSPETVMVYSDSGIGGMSRMYHALYRKNLARGKWRDRERPIVINNWEATYFDYNPKKLFEIADKASAAGIEMFVLDDGWFGKRNDDKSSLGDWYVNKEKLPGGLSEVADGIKKRGMMFGLWVEPEMVSPDSDLYRAHPDWALHINGRKNSLGRSQLVLDLSRDDVVDYLIKTFSEIFSSADISYVKWDFNRSPTEVGSETLLPEKQMETGHRYYLGLYKFLETLVNRFPKILFESCSGGGGRFDPAMFYYMPQCWTSDNTDALSRLHIQDGTSIVYPASFMTAHVSAVPNHQVGRDTPLSLRAHVAMRGVFGYELDLTKLSDEEFSEITEQVSLYKKIRRTVQFGSAYRLETAWNKKSVPRYTEIFAWENISEDKKQVVLTVAWLYAEANMMPEIVKLKGLEEDSVYEVKYSSVNISHYTRGGKIENKISLFGEVGKKYSGAELMYAGAPVCFMPKHESVLIVLEKIC